jgi:hypothetical protein
VLDEGDLKQPVIFVTGAGFSRAVSAHMPLAVDLIAPAMQAVGETVPVNDIEAWLSYLATQQPFLDPASNHDNQARFLRVGEAIAAAIKEGERAALTVPPPAWLTDFVWVTRALKAKVITFNYDTLLERASQILGLGGVRPLHLHGSIAEAWDPSDVNDTGASGASEGWTAPSYGWEKSLRYRPLLVPPVITKSPFYDSKVLRERWLASLQLLREAGTVVVIGYSIPTADFVSSYLLRDGISPEADVVVCDPAVEQVSRRMAGLLGRPPTAAFGGECAIDDLTKALGNIGRKRLHEMLWFPGPNPDDRVTIRFYIKVGMREAILSRRIADAENKIGQTDTEWAVSDARRAFSELIRAGGKVEGRQVISVGWGTGSSPSDGRRSWTLDLGLLPSAYDFGFEVLDESPAASVEAAAEPPPFT